MVENIFSQFGRNFKEALKEELDVISDAFKSGARGDDSITEEFEVPVEGEPSEGESSEGESSEAVASEEEAPSLKRKLSSFMSVTRVSSERETHHDERIERELNELRENTYRVVRNERKQLSDEEQIDSILNFSDDAFTPELRVERVDDESPDIVPTYEKPENDDPFAMILGEMDRASKDETT